MCKKVDLKSVSIYSEETKERHKTIDYWQTAYQTLIRFQRQAKVDNNPDYVIQALKWTEAEIMRKKQGRNRQGQREGKLVVQKHQNNFEDQQLPYGLNGTDVANRMIKNRLGGKVNNRERDET